jgi:hypothetical protein
LSTVLPYAAEPLRRALTYPLASWHLSNPPRTSSLPSDPRQSRCHTFEYTGNPYTSPPPVCPPNVQDGSPVLP